jgi:Cys-rich repeat protein
VKGNCRVDADCGAGGYCSPSSNTGICGDSLAGYYCQTPADLCIDDSDCPGSPVGSSGTIIVGNPGCVYSTTDSRWECIVAPVCG